MKTVRRPLALVAAGIAIAVASTIALVSAGMDGAGAGPGRFPVLAHDGMAPGALPALVLLLGLALIGIGAALHDGRELRGSSPRSTSRPTRAAAPGATRTAAPRSAQVLSPRAPRPVPVFATPVAHARRTSSGTRLELVSAARRG